MRLLERMICEAQAGKTVARLPRLGSVFLGISLERLAAVGSCRSGLQDHSRH